MRSRLIQLIDWVLKDIVYEIDDTKWESIQKIIKADYELDILPELEEI